MATRMKGLDYRPTLWYYDLLAFIHNDDDDNILDFTEGELIDVRLTLPRTLIAITIYFAFRTNLKTFRSLNVVKTFTKKIKKIQESDGNKYEEDEKDETKAKRLKVTEVFEKKKQNNVHNMNLNNTRDSIADRINDEEALAFGRTIGLH